MARGLLEQFVGELNANLFLREFAFSRTLLRVEGVGEIEIADHLILLDDLALAFQLKEREDGATKEPSETEKWFRNKVLKKAVQQIKDTKSLLAQHAGKTLVNDRGHHIEVPAALPKRFVNVVLYQAEDVPPSVANVRHYQSKTAGLIHVIPGVDYLGICQYLVTPVEIADYLEFRASVLTRHETNVSEAALVGQFLVDELSSVPAERYSRALTALKHDQTEWDISFLTANLARQITYTEGSESERAYYPIIAELAKLSRAELREFKSRLYQCVEAVREDRLELPYRFAVPRTGCGFVLVPVTQKLRPTARIALENFAMASKYELKMEKQVGAAVWKDGEYTDIMWLYAEGPNPYDPQLEEALKEKYPFRKTREKELPRYFFDSERLSEELGSDDG
jgi:hypothetical protein